MTVPGTQRIRVALIGAGLMGSLHARVVSQSPDAELSCIIDPNEGAGMPVAERFRTRWLPKLDDLGPFDAVIVASPTETHAEWGQQAIAAGKPVLVEKPLSEDADETHQLIDEARRRGVPLMCGLLERFNPAVMTAMTIVDEPIHITSVRHSPYADRIATGVAYDLLIHDIDLVLRFTDAKPVEVRAQLGHCHPKSAAHAEDVAEVSMQFETGCVASLSASRVSQRKLRMMHIAELDRLVEIDLFRRDVTVYRHVGAELIESASGGYRQQTVIDIPALTTASEPLAGQLAHFLDLARGDADAAEELASLDAPHRLTAQAVEFGGSTLTP
ncbi:MAG TPA: Gfo/Idh/MocA family oxidoreductase [Acidimicrobiia bacterium]|nr:Gfo/Idh/MocA family oxidoreductase [Acidimicrobiia bacterium]